MVCHKALQWINGYSLIDQVSAATEFTWSRTDVTANQRKRALFLDDAEGLLIISVAYLANVARNIDAGGAGPLAGCGTLIRDIFADYPPGLGSKRHNVLGTGINTSPATHTATIIYHGQVIITHVQGPELTDLYAGP
jgi:hypothetical protein